MVTLCLMFGESARFPKQLHHFIFLPAKSEGSNTVHILITAVMVDVEGHLTAVVICISLVRRERQPTPVFLPGEFHGQRSLVGYSPRDITEQLSLSKAKEDFRRGESNTQVETK